ncbi:MAG: nucleotidyltransferase family protein [candidate division WWE3 bacterium]|nr:nucleotidyltransferase family protein [candidate division WWE3 bacterium]
MLADPLSKKDALADLCRQYGIKYLALFGSYARGEATPESDVDLLIRFKQESVPSYFGLFDIEKGFENLLGKKVDLVQKDYLKELVHPYVDRDLKPIYEER